MSSSIQVYDEGYGRTQVLPMHKCSLCLPGIVLATEHIGRDVCINEQMGGWMSEWMDEQMNERMDGCMHKWMNK